MIDVDDYSSDDGLPSFYLQQGGASDQRKRQHDQSDGSQSSSGTEGHGRDGTRVKKPKHGAGKKNIPAMTERQQVALLMRETGSYVWTAELLGLRPPQPEAFRAPSPRRPRSSTSKVNAKNRLGETALQRAAIKGDAKQVCELLSQGALVNVHDNAGWTPLHEAANHGFLDVATVLVEAGADVNAKGMGGDTPLHDAAINGHTSIVSLLLDNGADPTATNHGGSTPLDTCTHLQSRTILEEAYLKATGKSHKLKHTPSPAKTKGPLRALPPAKATRSRSPSPSRGPQSGKENNPPTSTYKKVARHHKPHTPAQPKTPRGAQPDTLLPSPPPTHPNTKTTDRSTYDIEDPPVRQLRAEFLQSDSPTPRSAGPEIVISTISPPSTAGKTPHPAVCAFPSPPQDTPHRTECHLDTPPPVSPPTDQDGTPSKEEPLDGVTVIDSSKESPLVSSSEDDSNGDEFSEDEVEAPRRPSVKQQGVRVRRMSAPTRPHIEVPTICDAPTEGPLKSLYDTQHKARHALLTRHQHEHARLRLWLREELTCIAGGLPEHVTRSSLQPECIMLGTNYRPGVSGCRSIWGQQFSGPMLGHSNPVTLKRALASVMSALAQHNTRQQQECAGLHSSQQVQWAAERKAAGQLLPFPFAPLKQPELLLSTVAAELQQEKRTERRKRYNTTQPQETVSVV